MSQVRTSQSDLPQPLRIVGSTLRRLPGVEQVGKVTDGALDWIGAVSPRGRRIVVYTGAGLLGVAGVVEWPVALSGAAIAWLTQPHAGQGATEGTGQEEDRVRNPESGTAQDSRQPAADPLSERYASGDRLAPSHFRQDHPDHPAHEQPAKIGDPVTTSALKQVAEASAHHDEPPHPPEHRSHRSGGRAG
ncbi:hypothetical protein ACFQ6S_07725 [Streptomyces sp. NPDC056479]|uniref:hypothetical protein n=1 Tax=Streptomyces sp. NPDC056479 TaxID=3345832 RepID=UPI0036B332F8